MQRRLWTRIVVLAAAGALALGLTTAPTESASAAVTFSDVSSAKGTTCNAFAQEIQWMANRGISTGWPVAGGVNEYRPYASITRDAMAAFMYRYAGSPAFAPPAVSPFRDVTPSTPFYKEITWMASKGYSTGWDVPGGKEYRPGASITRDAMSAFLYRYSGSPTFTAPSTSPFVDVPVSNSFYKPIAWLNSKKISTGWVAGGGKEFRPFAPITRDAMAAFLYRHGNSATVLTPVDCSPTIPGLPAEFEGNWCTQSGSNVCFNAATIKARWPNAFVDSVWSNGAASGTVDLAICLQRDFPNGCTTASTMYMTYFAPGVRWNCVEFKVKGFWPGCNPDYTSAHRTAEPRVVRQLNHQQGTYYNDAEPMYRT